MYYDGSDDETNWNLTYHAWIKTFFVVISKEKRKMVQRIET